MKEIQLTQGYKALVDDEDFERINYHKWFAIVTITGPNGFHISAHRWSPGSYPNRHMLNMANEVLNIDGKELASRGRLIDHKNRNPLDNQKHNLREANKSINAYNSDRSINAKGVYFEPSRNRWKAFLLRPRKKYVGTYKTEAEAIEARQKALQQ